MPVRRDKSGRWRYREVIDLGGKRQRITGSAPRHDNTKAACLRELRKHIDSLRQPAEPEKEVHLTFEQWFQGRFWTEWVLGEENKPGTQEEKESVFRCHLRSFFGAMPVCEIDQAAIQRFKAELQTKPGRLGDPLSRKTRNNILAVLSKALRYAEEVEVIDKAPHIRLYRVERPEIVYWEFEQYAQLIQAARATEPAWYAAALLAGEAGLRIGEILALRWDFIDTRANVLTVAKQVRRGKEGTPKGRTRRTIPMTEPLVAALAALPRPHSGKVLRHPGGGLVTEGETKHVIYDICEAAELLTSVKMPVSYISQPAQARFGADSRLTTDCPTKIPITMEQSPSLPFSEMRTIRRRYLAIKHSPTRRWKTF